MDSTTTAPLVPGARTPAHDGGRMLRPYQREAVDAIVAGLADGGRGQLHAACGAGKTFMSLTAATRLLPGNALIIVLAPSLSLVAQTVQAWQDAGAADTYLGVCYDSTVIDEATRLNDIHADTTTNPEGIAAWLGVTTGRRLIVGTYASADRLAQALRATGQPADLVIYDEAHHLTGRPDFVTRRVVGEEYLPARRRLFMTATPRVNDARAEWAGELSMSDRTVFGPVLYTYPWGTAIRDGYLDDYRIAVIGVRHRDVQEMLADTDHLYVERAGGPDLRTLAAQAVIAKAARRFGLRRILAFCPRLDAAREFTRTLPSLISRTPDGERPDGPVHADHVSGEMTHHQRDRVLGTLREPPGTGGWTVITNVRCLSEGVDVPAVDAVAFVHPKRSQVDIVQAVGRALRRSGTARGVATIIVPIVVPDSDEQIGDLDPGEYRTLWQVVRALRAHDESLGIELDSQRSHGSASNPQLPSRITVQLPPGAGDDAMKALTLMMVRQTTSVWWTGYGHARDYAEKHGDLLPLSTHRTPDGFALGTWLANARQHRRKGWLRPDRVAALDRIGMVWDTRNHTWEVLLRELRAYRRQYGDLLVPQTYVTPDGYPLGTRVNAARTRARRTPETVRAVLDDLGMVWDTRDLRWQELFGQAQRFAAEHGHLTVPKTYVTPDGYPLGVRLATARQKDRDGKLDPAERASLADIGLDFGNRKDHKWDEFLAACDRYTAVHGTLRTVRRDHIDETGYALGSRIMYYRALHKGTVKGGVPAERRAALDARGMLWEGHAPARDITPAEGETLRALPPGELPTVILRLLDEERVTQSSIADALNLARSAIGLDVRKFRATGHWPTRRKKHT
ncbi:Helicase associated domain protein [Streptomyces uncialis]|uniref:DEAD/DEAH box helicase n=1 Tax=Streptomyces uncialis TaxID=1048205 RepID=UPI0038120F57